MVGITAMVTRITALTSFLTVYTMLDINQAVQTPPNQAVTTLGCSEDQLN